MAASLGSFASRFPHIISFTLARLSVGVHSVSFPLDFFFNAFLLFPPICVRSIQHGFVLPGYDYPCHTNVENICVHISTYLQTHAGVSRDTV